MKTFRRIILKHDLFNPILPVFILMEQADIVSIEAHDYCILTIH
jgi:hypothetical protein